MFTCAWVLGQRWLFTLKSTERAALGLPALHGYIKWNRISRALNTLSLSSILSSHFVSFSHSLSMTGLHNALWGILVTLASLHFFVFFLSSMLVMSSFSTFWQASSFRPLYKPESPCGASFQQDLSVLGAVTSVIIKIDGPSLALGHLTLQSAPSTAVQGWNWAIHYLHFYLLTSAIQLFWWETNQSACPCTLTFQLALIEIISYKHTHLKEIVQLKKGTYSLSCQELDEKINSQPFSNVCEYEAPAKKPN